MITTDSPRPCSSRGSGGGAPPPPPTPTTRLKSNGLSDQAEQESVRDTHQQESPEERRCREPNHLRQSRPVSGIRSSGGQDGGHLVRSRVELGGYRVDGAAPNHHSRLAVMNRL